ncbi:hypothetical protein [Geodermatophilus sp. SYSU D00079]
MFEVIVRRGPASDVVPEAPDHPGASGPPPGSAHSRHWARPDVAGDLVAAALTPGAAAPREIRVRPELHERVVAELGPTGGAPTTLGPPPGVPLVVDPELPACPGFEVVRARPAGVVPPHAAAA